MVIPLPALGVLGRTVYRVQYIVVIRHGPVGDGHGLPLK